MRILKKIKALFLLVTFSFNSVVGAACSMGLDMEFNSGHHNQEEEEQPSHSHKNEVANSGNHHHDKHSHSHKHSHSDEHNTSAANSNSSLLSASEDENCCNGFVTAFQNLDKQLVEKSQVAKAKICLTPFILPASATSINNADYAEPIITPPKIPGYSQPDIRIFIQSFQI